MVHTCDAKSMAVIKTLSSDLVLWSTNLLLNRSEETMSGQSVSGSKAGLESGLRVSCSPPFPCIWWKCIKNGWVKSNFRGREKIFRRFSTTQVEVTFRPSSTFNMYSLKRTQSLA